MGPSNIMINLSQYSLCTEPHIAYLYTLDKLYVLQRRAFLTMEKGNEIKTVANIFMLHIDKIYLKA
jgi:hypothetical protein